MEQYQRANANQNAKQGRGVEDRNKVSAGHILSSDQEQSYLQNFDEYERDCCRAHQSQRFIAAIIGEKPVQHEQPRQITRDLAQFHDRPSWSKACCCKAPVGSQRQGHDSGHAISSACIAPAANPQRRESAAYRAYRISDIGQTCDPGGHLAPSGHRITRAVCKRMRRSRKGV